MSTEHEIRNCTIAMAATPTEKAAFKAFCASKELRPAQMLRLMLSRVCPGNIEPGDVPTKHLTSVSMHVRLNEEEAREIRLRAKGESTTGPGWIRKAIRSVLFKQPNFNPAEVNALRESNRELAYLGRNINQIARELHMSNYASDQINARFLESLAKDISMHRDRISSLLNANWGRVVNSDIT